MEELDQLFNDAHKAYLSVIDSQLASNSPEYQQQVQHAVQSINSSAELISQEHVFSVNEELDDVRTDYIK